MKKQTFVFWRTLITIYCLIMTADMTAQWPQWRGPERDGISKEKNLLKAWPAEGPRLLWSVDTVGDGFSSTAIQDQMIYTTGKRDSIEILTALDINGNLKWQREAGRASREKDWPQSRCTPTVFKNKVYTITVFGDIACFDSRSGKISWKLNASEKTEGSSFVSANGVTESPLLFDDKMIITPCGNSTTMIALNRLTGERIWKTEGLQDSTYFTSPVLLRNKDKKAVFTTTNRHDIIVDCNTGKIIWKDNRISGMIPLISDDLLYFTGAYKKGGSMYRLNAELNNRTVLWTDTISANELGGAVLINDKIVVSGNGRGIFCIDSKTGKVLSHYDRVSYCNLIVADNMVYCFEDRTGKVCLFKINDNNIELVSSFKINSGNGPRIAHMAIANGLLLIRHGRVLMAYDIKQKA